MTRGFSAHIHFLWLVSASLTLFSSCVSAELLPRDFDKNGSVDGYYDTKLNITWLADANKNGIMTWDQAQLWASTLVVSGIGGWRLPAMLDPGRPGCDIVGNGQGECGVNVPTTDGAVVFSEMASLWYDTLGNVPRCELNDFVCDPPQPGWGLQNTGGFVNLLPRAYWSSASFYDNGVRSWYFYMAEGFQYYESKNQSENAMAVHDGDILAVDEPGNVVLFLAGLFLMAVLQCSWIRLKQNSKQFLF